MSSRLAAIAAVICDVDGVLTDGRLYYDRDGESLKAFSVRDGLGIKRLDEAGIAFAIISGRRSPALERRLDDLGVKHRMLGVRDKGAALAEMLEALGLEASQVLAIGDDAVDRPVLERAAIGVAVADAHPDLLAVADMVTRAVGGAGAVREIADRLLEAQKAAPFVVVIPSRLGSSRLPRKPLAEIAGRPMIAHVWDRAVESGASEIVIATDSPEIAGVVAGFGGQAALTSEAHRSGTDRIAEVARKRRWPADAIVVNLQGDEPALPGDLVAAVARDLAEHPWASIATLAAPITDPARLFDPNVVKVVRDHKSRALLFSRAPIPWVREAFTPGEIPGSLPGDVEFLRHIGLYAYRVSVLERLTSAAPVPIETAESLEQLRALALGLDICVTTVKKAPPDGVDTANDLARIKRHLQT